MTPTERSFAGQVCSMHASIQAAASYQGISSPGSSVSGVVKPETANPVELSASCVTVTESFPVLVSVAVCVVVCPTVVFGKVIMDGEI